MQPYVYFMLADPAMPISPTYVAAGYPLCTPFVNPLSSAYEQKASEASLETKSHFMLYSWESGALSTVSAP
jgi:hypothetical protein